MNSVFAPGGKHALGRVITPLSYIPKIPTLVCYGDCIIRLHTEEVYHCFVFIAIYASLYLRPNLKPKLRIRVFSIDFVLFRACFKTTHVSSNIESLINLNKLLLTKVLIDLNSNVPRISDKKMGKSFCKYALQNC